MNDCDQRTLQWFADRAKCITASRMSDLYYEQGVFKTGPRAGQSKPPTKARMDYIDQIVAEILTDGPKDSVNAKALDYGKEMEPQALAAYEFLTGNQTETCGFIRHPDYSFIGASPDFLAGTDGGGEIKCPMSIVVHATTLREGLPSEHIEQIQGGLWVTGRQWWDFISYNPKFPYGLDLYVQRIERDNEAIAKIQEDCLSAWQQVQEILKTLEARKAA